ncbi:MAG: hypothetical protein KTR16_10265 [Acidiferrobacterales bacterium]|nr:hypothetical protein [Acidiferrobacterales bacterium]
MNYSRKSILSSISAFALLTSAMTSTAQDELPREERLTSPDEMFAIVEQGLPKIITEDNSELLSVMLSPRLGKPLKDVFDLDVAEKRLFPSQDTQRECDEKSRSCEITEGIAEGSGSYSKLAVIDDGAAMSVRFSRRDEQSEKIVSTKMDDISAYGIASNLLVETLGVPVEEIPVAPSNAKYPLPVKTVNLSLSDGEGKNQTIPVDKLVKIQRGLYFGRSLGWLPGPGKISVALNESGISSAVVRSWADMSRYGENLDARDAKSRSELVEELVTRFQREGIARVHSARSMLAVALPAGASSPIPVLRVFASAQPRDLDEKSQASVVSSAGVVIDLPLIAAVDDQASQEESE